MRNVSRRRQAVALVVFVMLGGPLAYAVQAPVNPQQATPQELKTGLRADAVQMGAGGLVAPVLVERELPKYPEGTDITGDVYIEAVVDKEGKVREPELIRGLANEEMNERAMQAIAKWEFKPGTVDGEPVNVIALFTVTFRVH